MNILHLGGNRLGTRIEDIVRGYPDEVVSVADRQAMSRAVADRTFDWIVSAGFRYLVPQGILDRATDTCNVHVSYLPWGRGCNPNVWMLVDGEPAGVTIHRMSAEFDEGPMFARRSVSTTFADVASDLYRRLEDEAVDLFAQTWPGMREGTVEPVPQEPGGTYHSEADMEQLLAIDLNAELTWRRALDILRALTFPPFENFVVEVDERQYTVEISIKETSDDPSA